MDLSLVHVDDLIKEIDKRHDAVVVLAMRSTGNEDSYDWHIHGNRAACLGMLVMLQDYMRGLNTGDETGGFTQD